MGFTLKIGGKNRDFHLSGSRETIVFCFGADVQNEDVMLIWSDTARMEVKSSDSRMFKNVGKIRALPNAIIIRDVDLYTCKIMCLSINYSTNGWIILHSIFVYETPFFLNKENWPS